MNSKAINFIKNFSYTFTSNFLSLSISTLVVLIVPRLIGVQDYGYWQLYLFYSSYVSFLHFGWSDGIYLRYGGKVYDKLDKPILYSQFYMLVILQSIMGIIIAIGSLVVFNDNNRLFVILMVALCLVITNVKSLPLFLLQGSNRIKEYANITIIGQLCYFGIVISLLIVGVRDFKLLIVADLIGRTTSLIFSVYFCRDIVFRAFSEFTLDFKEMMENIAVGIKVMFAYIANLLLIGVVRFGIERSWSVDTFGKVSLILSISNMLMVFINAIGIILFPILKRTNEKMLSTIYMTIRDLLMVLLLGILILYYPLKAILSSWLPDYAETLRFLALLFPIIIFEGKAALLINTYFKTLRKEELMLMINLFALALSVVLTIINTVIVRNLELTIISILIILAVKNFLSEIMLSRILGISFKKDLLLEILLTIIFVLTGWFINSYIVVLIYVICYICYLYLKRRDIYNTYKNLRLLIRVK